MDEKINNFNSYSYSKGGFTKRVKELVGEFKMLVKKHKQVRSY